LLLIPAPFMVSVKAGLAVMVYPVAAPALNKIPSTVVLAEIETAAMFEVWNVAMSAVPFGTVACTQLFVAFQSPLAGFCNHVALPA